MQIDGHYAVTYVAARIAGFNREQAETIAYAAQYVDDATNDGAIFFEDSEYLYSRIASAHGMIDYHNVVDVANHLAWLPFHFLPGNGGLPAGQSPGGHEVHKLVCVADSHVARDMLKAAIQERGAPRELHRLGIAMHVYADTFAHEGFVGAISEANLLSDRKCKNATYESLIQKATFRELLIGAWRKTRAVWMLVKMSVLQAVQERKWPGAFWRDFLAKTPLGHAKADVFPDQPYLIWSYVDWKGQKVERRNPEIFHRATDMMVRAMRAWLAGDTAADLMVHKGLNDADANVIGSLFRELDHTSGLERDRLWRDAISAGRFSFGAVTLSEYVDKGPGSWKAAALGNIKRKDSGLERYPFRPEFMATNWKLFHDALQAHRHDVIRNILPRYGICAA